MKTALTVPSSLGPALTFFTTLLIACSSFHLSPPFSLCLPPLPLPITQALSGLHLVITLPGMPSSYIALLTPIYFRKPSNSQLKMFSPFLDYQTVPVIERIRFIFKNSVSLYVRMFNIPIFISPL